MIIRVIISSSIFRVLGWKSVRGRSPPRRFLNSSNTRSSSSRSRQSLQDDIERLGSPFGKQGAGGSLRRLVLRLTLRLNLELRSGLMRFMSPRLV